MDVDVPASEEVEVKQYDISFTLLISTQRSLHGIRHSDYDRYRQYCSNRLRTLHRKLKFTHGRHKFVARKLEATGVKEVRHLHIPLIGAERAWAYSTSLKRRSEQEGSLTSEERDKMIKRMRKAAAHASELVRLANAVASPRAALEAEAYLMTLRGLSLYVHETDWRAALSKLARAKAIYTELMRSAPTPDTQAAYRQQLDEIEPTVRFCSYQLGRRSGTNAAALTPAEEERLALEGAEAGGADLAAIRGQLAAQREKEQSRQLAATSRVSITWRRGEFAARCDAAAPHVQEAAGAAAAAAEAGAALGDAGWGSTAATAGAVEAYAKACDKVTGLYTAAAAAARSAEAQLGPAASSEAQELSDELRSFRLVLTGLATDWAVRRALVQAQRGAGLLARAAARAGGASWCAARDRPPRPEDVTRSCDELGALATALGDIGLELRGPLGEALMEEASARGAEFAALRCVVLALGRLLGRQPHEAYALLTRAEEKAGEAESRLSDLEFPPEGAKAVVEWAKSMAEGLSAVAAAEAASLDASDREGLQRTVGALTVEERVAGTGEGYLSDHLDQWQSFAGSLTAPGTAGYEPPKVAPALPALRAALVRPLFLDTVLSSVHYPNVDARTKKQAAGAAPGLFGKLFSFRS